MQYAALFELASDYLCKRTYRGLGDVCDFEFHRVGLVACAEGGNNRDILFVGGLDEMKLGRYDIDGIDDIVVVLGEDLLSRFGAVKHIENTHVAGWVDFAHTLSAHLHLFSADSAFKGDNLAVDIRDVDCIEIEKVDIAHTASCDGLDCKAAYTTCTHYKHALILKLFHIFASEKKLCSFKSSVHI